MKALVKGKRKFIIAVIFIVICITVIVIIQNSKEQRTQWNNSIELLSRRGLSKTISFNGKIESASKTYITTDLVGMKVKSLNVQEGDYVKTGDIIAVLDITSLKEQIEHLERKNSNQSKIIDLQLKQTQEVLEYIESKKSIQLVELNNQLKTAKSKLNILEKKYSECQKKKMNKQKRNQSTFELDVEIAKYRADIQDCKSSIDLYKTQYKDKQEEYNNQIAEVEANLMLSTNERNFDDTYEIDTLNRYIGNAVIKAETSGIITNLNIEKGGYCLDKNLAVIEKPEQLQISGYLNTADYFYIKEGTEVEIVTESIGNNRIPGIIKSVEEVSNGEGFKTITTIDNSKYQLKLNMNVSVIVYLEKKSDCLAVPYDSIMFNEMGEPYIYKLEKRNDNQYNVIEQRVDIGMDSYYYTEITGDGIQEGDYIITEPKSFKANQKISMKAG